MKVIIHEIREEDAQILVSFEKDLHKEKVLLDLGEWIKISYVKTGEAEITIDDDDPQLVTFVKHLGAFKKEKGEKKSGGEKGTKKSEKWEDDMVTFETLLTKAHELKKPFSIFTKMLQLDLGKKFALFKATIKVTTPSKRNNAPDEVTIFEGHGDATEDNVTGDYIKPHFIRMAETRSIVRALRWYTNNGCAEEEK